MIKKIFKPLVILTILFSLFLVLPNKVSAQGTYDCDWVNGECAPVSSCSPGCFVPVPDACINTPHPDTCVEASPQDNPCSCSDAHVGNPLLPDSLRTGDPGELMSKLIQLLINIAFVVGVLVFIFMMISGAYGWMTSGGDKSAVSSARSRMTNAFVGLIILFSLFWLLKLLETFFGISILSLDLGALTIQ